MNKIEIKSKNIYYINSTTAEIDLSLGGPPYAIIDIEDILYAMEHVWTLKRRTVTTKLPNKSTMALKRYLLDVKDPNIFVVHRDGNVFNCRRDNLLTMPRGDLNKYKALAKRNIAGQTRAKADAIAPKSTSGLSYNPSAPIGYHFGQFTPLEHLGNGMYRCSTPETVTYHGKLVKTVGLMDVSVTDLYNELERRYNKGSNKFVKGHPKHDKLINKDTLFKGRQLIADVKPEKHKSVEPGPRPEPDAWYESGKYVVYEKMKLKVVDKRWIEEHSDPEFWEKGEI